MADKRRGKKRSKAFYIKGSSSAGKKMRRDKFLDVGMRGFLLTCNHRENICISEGYSLLGEYADKLYEPERLGIDVNASSGNESESEPDDIEASLKREVAQMKRKKAQKEMRFEAINSGAKNIIFIRTKLPDPTELVHHLLMDIADTQTCKSRHIMRLLPVNVTFRATTEDISKHAPGFLHPYFHADGVDPTTFAVGIKIRNNASTKRDDVINLVAAIVMGKGILKHKVDLDDPELFVVVEIIKNVCCLSVVRDYKKLKRYNLQEIVTDGGAAQKAGPGRSAKGTQRKSGDDESEAKDRTGTAQHDKDTAEVMVENQTEFDNSDVARVKGKDMCSTVKFDREMQDSVEDSDLEKHKTTGNDKSDWEKTVPVEKQRSPTGKDPENQASDPSVTG